MDEDASTADPERVDTTPETLAAAAKAYAASNPGWNLQVTRLADVASRAYVASNPGWNLQVTKFTDVAAKIYAENNAVGTKLAALATAVAAGAAPIDLIGHPRELSNPSDSASIRCRC
jgi:hypothetical protein